MSEVRAAPTIFVSAGEESGDLHGAGLVRALLRRWPRARIIGLGGERMRAAGAELLAELDQLAVMGFAEVLRHLPFFIKLRRQVFAALDAEGVDLVIPIDYPGFNLRLAERARMQGIPVLYYIAPQVWAWHKKRVHDIARNTDAVAAVLPFEEPFLRSAGVAASFVGHPLLDVPPPACDRAAWAEAHQIDPARPILALLPGSRAQEVRRHLALFCDAAEQVRQRRPDVRPVIGVPPALNSALYSGAPFPRVPAAGGELLQHADAAIVKSGTSTLETALAGTPFVVAYRVNPLSYQIASRVVDVPHIALANLIAGERIVPEFVQDAATPRSLADAVLPMLDREGSRRAEVVGKLQDLRRHLGGPGAADRVAEMAAALLKQHK